MAFTKQRPKFVARQVCMQHSQIKSVLLALNGTLATFTSTVSLLGNFKFGTVEVSKLRPTNNDAGSHAVKL